MGRRALLIAGALSVALSLPGCSLTRLCQDMTVRNGLTPCAEDQEINQPPEIRSIERSDFAPQTNRKVKFTADVVDPDRDADRDFDSPLLEPLQFEWLSSEPKDPENLTVTFEVSYQRPGRKTVRLRVRDYPAIPGVETEAAASQTFRVHTPEQLNRDRPPTASFKFAPNPAVVGQPVIFDASESSDPEGDRLVFDWEEQRATLGDGEGPTLTKTFSTLATQEMTLRVYDEYGKSATSTQQVPMVAPDPEQPGPSAPPPDQGGGSGSAPGGSGSAPGGSPRTAHQPIGTGWTVWPAQRRPRLAPRRAFVAELRARPIDDSGYETVATGAGTLRARLAGGRPLTKAERQLKRLLAARWRSRLPISFGQGRATLDGHVVTTSRRDRGCLKLSLVMRAGELPTGKFRVLGGTRTAARLYAEGSFRFQIVGKRPALILGTLRAGLGRARGLPRACTTIG